MPYEKVNPNMKLWKSPHASPLKRMKKNQRIKLAVAMNNDWNLTSLEKNALSRWLHFPWYRWWGLTRHPSRLSHRGQWGAVRAEGGILHAYSVQVVSNQNCFKVVHWILLRVFLRALGERCHGASLLMVTVTLRYIHTWVDLCGSSCGSRLGGRQTGVSDAGFCSVVVGLWLNNFSD